MHGRDTHGAVASLASVAKIPFMDSQDGISNTFTIVPDALGKDEEGQENNLVSMLDGYIEQGGHHLNVNVLNRDTLLDAQKHPELYPRVWIRRKLHQADQRAAGRSNRPYVPRENVITQLTRHIVTDKLMLA